MELLIVNGWARTIYRPEDFETLIQEHMGDDAAAYFRRYHAPESGPGYADSEYLKAENADLREDLAAIRDAAHRAMHQFTFSRTNWKGVKKLVDFIEKRASCRN